MLIILNTKQNDNNKYDTKYKEPLQLVFFELAEELEKNEGNTRRFNYSIWNKYNRNYPFYSFRNSSFNIYFHSNKMNAYMLILSAYTTSS